MKTQLYFYEPLIREYQKALSLIEDYYRRTMVVFSDIDEEANKYADEIYQNYPATEHTDPADIAELAQNRALERYEALSIMKSNHLRMTISMLYHMWEQQLIKFTIYELQHYFKFNKMEMSFGNVQKIFRLHGVDIEKTESWAKIRELKFLVNTVKHGEGESADKLRRIRPDFFRLPDTFEIGQGTDTLKLYGSVLLDDYSLQVYEKDLYGYIEATKNFWDEMPERVYSDTDRIITEFEKHRGRMEDN